MASIALFKPRPLGLQERYQLAQAQCGSMPLIIIVAFLPNINHGDMRRQITINCEALRDVYPILSATIDDRLTRKPRWKPHNPQMSSTRRIVDTKILFSDEIDAIVAREDRKGQGLNLDNGPLWRVGLYGTKNGTKHGCGQFVALTICHILTDGMGALDLLHRILPNGVDHNTIMSSKQSQLPPKAEDRIEFYQSRVGRFDFIRGRLDDNSHWALDYFTKDMDAWPTGIVSGRRDSQVKHKSVNFGPDCGRILEGVRSYYKNTTVLGSVHSVLHTAAVVALAATGRIPSPATWGLGNQSIKSISTETPMSLRSFHLGHPSFGGNYVAPISKSFPLPDLEAQDVGEFTAAYKIYLDSPQTNEDARRRVSMLQYIPDPALPGEFRSKIRRSRVARWLKIPKVAKTPVEPGHKVSPEPTGWEKSLAEQANSASPYRASLGISNLGAFRSHEVEKVWFCHTSMPWGAALNIDVVSCIEDKQEEGDVVLSVMVSWLNEVIETKNVERFMRAFAMVVNQFADAGNTSPEASFALQKVVLKDLI